jgi:MraZ protein
MAQTLRDLIGLDKQIVLSGIGRKFEIWNEADWAEQYTQTINPSDNGAPLPPELEQLAY